MRASVRPSVRACSFVCLKSAQYDGVGVIHKIFPPRVSQVEEAFAALEAFMATHPHVYWDPSKSFAAGRA